VGVIRDPKLDAQKPPSLDARAKVFTTVALSKARLAVYIFVIGIPGCVESRLVLHSAFFSSNAKIGFV
jgi:hypothetical protein